MDEKMYSKQEVIQHVWSYSRFYSQQLFQCEEFFKDGKGYAAITILFTVLENIIKLAANDYDSSFYDVSKELADKSIITDEEYKFISTNQFSIRKIRNLFAHANLFAVNIVNIEDDREILYPFTEEESCLLLYTKVSYSSGSANSNKCPLAHVIITLVPLQYSGSLQTKKFPMSCFLI
nr:TM1812 family CRISPR-associated protein [Streptococcus gallolyticus]